MPKRMTERYDVDAIRLMRGELKPWLSPGTVPLSDFVDQVFPGGSVFHILMHVPDDTGIELTILIDGRTIVFFELYWVIERNFFGFRKPVTRVGGAPADAEIWTLDGYRRALGQGKTRILLDHAVADARRFLA